MSESTGEVDKLYIGAKIIRAVPMDEFAFLATKGTLNKTNIDNIDNRENREGYRVTYPNGYVSWSPKETFEIAYREVTGDERKLLFVT